MIAPMRMNSTLAWLVDAAAECAGAGELLAELGAHLVADGLPLAGGALTLDVPHPLIARRTWLWRAASGEVIEGLGFASEGPAAPVPRATPGDDGSPASRRAPCTKTRSGGGRMRRRSPGRGHGHSPRASRTTSARPRALPRRRSLRSRRAPH